MTSKEPSVIEILHAMDEQDKAKAAEVKLEYPIVIPELQDLLDELREEETKELEASILREGIRDNAVVWKERNAVIDGHNRNRLAQKHKLPLPRIEKSFETIEQVKEWIFQNQLGRRNLTPDRFEYLIGKLYNTKKQGEPKQVGGVRVPTEGGTTAETLAKQFGVSERTVRRAGETSIGIDKLEQIKGKIAKQDQLSGKGAYTKPELTELGKHPVAVGKKMLEKLDVIKDKVANVKKAAKEEKKAVAASPESYPVVFAAPDFEAFGFSVSSQAKPPMSKDAIVYMKVPDAYLANGMELVTKWGLTYECSFIYYGYETEEGVYSKVAHDFMIVATKGHVIGPKQGTEMPSVQKANGDKSAAMVKLIEHNHPNGKKLDFRKGKPAAGWEAFNKKD